MSDLNNNGIPDHKEPWFWLTLGRVASFFVRLFAPPHTVAHKVAVQYDEQVKRLHNGPN